MEDWMIFVGSAICSCVLVAVLFGIARRSRRRGNVHVARTANAASRPQPPALPSQPAPRNRTGSGSRRPAPPPLPGEAPAVDLEIYDYPKCPVDRVRNTPGRPQVVFRDPARRCFYCSRGHRFTGREH